MANQIDNLTLGGTPTLDTSAYLQRVHIGQAAASFNVATGTDDLGVKGRAEIVGVLYPYGGVNSSGAAQDWTLAAGQANALRVRGTSGGSLRTYLDFDTTNTVLETEVELRFSKTYGLRNAAGGTCAMRQDEVYNLGALAALDTAGGILNIVNPSGIAGLATLILRTTTVATGACTIDAGFGTTGTLYDTSIDGLDVNAATGEFSSVKNPGTNGRPYKYIGATDYITISKATGAAAGLAGNAWLQIVPLS